ncbi:hypothetical protein Tco_1502148 [Tanacetum coccineum]
MCMLSNTRMSKSKKKDACNFRSLHHTHQFLSKDDLKCTRIEHGYKTAFMSLFGQDVDTSQRTKLLQQSIRTDSKVQDDSSRSGNDTDADDADIRPIYDEEPMAEVQLTAECNIFAIGQQHTEQPEIIVEDKNRQHLANNAELKAQIQEKVFAIAALKNDLRKLKGNSVDTKFDKTSVLGKPVLQSLRNQSVVRQPNAFKSARAQMSKQR